MSLTTNSYRTATGERLATVKLTVHVSADEIALALMSSTGAAYEPDTTEVPVTEAAIREALKQLFLDGLETASYRVGDNHADERCAEVQVEVVNAVFGGNEFYEKQS